MKDNLKIEFQEYVISLVSNLLLIKQVKNILINKLEDKAFLKACSNEGIMFLSTFFLMYINSVLLDMLKLADYHKKDDDCSLRYCIHNCSKCFNLDVKKDLNTLDNIRDKYYNVRNKSIAHLTKQHIVMGDYPKVSELDEYIEIIKDMTLKYGKILQCDISSLMINEHEIIRFFKDIDLTLEGLDVKKLFDYL